MIINKTTPSKTPGLVKPFLNVRTTRSISVIILVVSYNIRPGCLPYDADPAPSSAIFVLHHGMLVRLSWEQTRNCLVTWSSITCVQCSIIIIIVRDALCFSVAELGSHKTEQ